MTTDHMTIAKLTCENDRKPRRWITFISFRQEGGKEGRKEGRKKSSQFYSFVQKGSFIHHSFKDNEYFVYSIVCYLIQKSYLLFPSESFHKNLRELISKIIAENM